VRFRVTEVDSAPADLELQVPFSFDLVRELPGRDRPDYWLASLPQPLAWKDGSEKRTIHALVIASRFAGERLTVDTKRVTIAIAYVVDETLLNDASFDFAKAKYVAIGTAERVP
jgi:hypothetical protein